MDRSVSAATKNNLFGTTWKSSIDTLKNIKKTSPGVKNIEVYLPYAAYREENLKSQLQFKYFDNENSIINPYKIFYANLFLHEKFNKQTFGIELTTDAEVIPQLFNRKYGYYYEWSTHKLTIRRILGTYAHKKIEKFIKELMNEYKRFYLMYCKTN